MVTGILASLPRAPEHSVSANQSCSSQPVSTFRLDPWEVGDHGVWNLLCCFSYLYAKHLLQYSVQYMFIELNDEPGLTFYNTEGSYRIRLNDNSQGLTPQERIYTSCSSSP